MKVSFIILIMVFFATSASGQKWKAIQNGIRILEGVLVATDLWDKWNGSDDDTQTAITFKTNSSQAVSIYIGNVYIGSIDDDNELTCKVDAGVVNYLAYSKSGINYRDNIYMKSGAYHEVFITETNLNTKYTSGASMAMITGDRVNIRSAPQIRQGNIVLKGYTSDRVQILDRVASSSSRNTRITTSSCWFYPDADTARKFKVVKGVAVTYLQEWNNDFDQVLLDTETKQLKGVIGKNKITANLNEIWFKVKLKGKIGWVYGDYIRPY